jgi:CheY-like chemotaxis protein
VSDEEARGQTANEADDAVAVAAGATVLVAEDEPVVRLSVAEALADTGFNVIEAGSGAEAARILASTRIDILFADVRIGRGPDGLELARRLRAFNPAAIVVIGTATDVPESELEVADSAFRKPYAVDAVVDRIARLVAKRRPDAAGAGHDRRPAAGTARNG